MKKAISQSIILFLLSILSAIYCSAQIDTVDSDLQSEYALILGINYKIHQNDFMYESAKYIFPYLGIDFGLVDRLDNEFVIRYELGYEYYYFNNPEKYNILIAYLSGSYNYKFYSAESTDLFLGLGISLNYARPKSEIIRTDYLGNKTGTMVKSQSKFGLGIFPEFVYQLELNKLIFINLGLRYDYTNFGKAEDGGFENLGGLKIQLRGIINL